MTSSARPPLRILCVDDNAMIVSALMRLLQHEDSLACAGIVREGDSAYDAVREIAPDIVLMDVDMPGVNTFDVVQRIAEDMPGVRVIMFSGHVNSEFIDRALDAGAWGYLSKNEDVHELIAAIKLAAHGEIVISKDAQIIRERSS